MAGPILFLQYFLIFLFFLLLFILLYNTIKQRHSFKKAIPTGLPFVILTAIAMFVYYKVNKNKFEASKAFLGDYKLEKLDNQICENCKIRLKNDFTYNIIKKDKIIGNGKWHLDTASDIPGYFLKLENGPTWVVWEEDRLIEYIDRTSEK